MTIADEARANAIPCEMILYAYRKNKEGIVVSFVVNAEDMPDALATARIGSRWVGALVQVNDDETPVQRKEASPAPRQEVNPRQPDGGKRDWRELQPQQQAGIRCGEPTFVAFLKEKRPDDWAAATDAAECVRLICGVHSRVELGTDHRARVIWHQLDSEYQAWKALEHA